MMVRARLFLQVFLLAVALASVRSHALALPLELHDVVAAKLPLAKAIYPSGAASAGRGAIEAPGSPLPPASLSECRTKLLLEGGLSETRWILATRYLFNMCLAGGEADGETRLRSTADSADFKGAIETAQKRLGELVQAEPTRVDAHLGLADCQRLRGDKAASEKALQQGIAAVPYDARLAFQLGELYVLQGRVDEAMAHFTHLAAQGPDAWSARKRIIELLLELGKVADAAPKLYEMFGVTTSDLGLHALHARMLIGKGDVAAGTQQLHEVLAQDGTLMRPHYYLALTAARGGQRALAASEFTECLRHDPDLVPARYALVHLHLDAGQFDLAHEQLTRVRKAMPDSFDVRLVASDVARGRGDRMEARQIAEQLVREAPDRCDGHFRLGQTYAAERQYDQALAEFSRALELSPTSTDVLEQLVSAMRAAGRPDAEVLRRVQTHADAHRGVAGIQLLLARLIINSGDQRGAVPVLEAALQADPTLSAARYLLGDVQVRLGNLPQARGQFDQVTGDEPLTAAAQMMLGLIDEADGRHADAERRYVRVLDIAPKYAPAANNLAWAYAQQTAKLDLALQHARQAKAELPSDPYVADTLGWILYRQRELEPAIRALKEAAAALPDRAEVRYHLGMVYRRNDNIALARTELRAAISIGGFAGLEEARQAFSEIDW